MFYYLDLCSPNKILAYSDTCSSPYLFDAMCRFLEQILASFTYGFCSSVIWEQQAAAGSPEVVRSPFQYSLPKSKSVTIFLSWNQFPIFSMSIPSSAFPCGTWNPWSWTLIVKYRLYLERSSRPKHKVKRPKVLSL